MFFYHIIKTYYMNVKIFCKHYLHDICSKGYFNVGKSMKCLLTAMLVIIKFFITYIFRYRCKYQKQIIWMHKYILRASFPWNMQKGIWTMKGHYNILCNYSELQSGPCCLSLCSFVYVESPASEMQIIRKWVIWKRHFLW